jgi:hypothetical protein
MSEQEELPGARADRLARMWFEERSQSDRATPWSVSGTLAAITVQHDGMIIVATKPWHLENITRGARSFTLVSSDCGEAAARAARWLHSNRPSSQS